MQACLIFVEQLSVLGQVQEKGHIMWLRMKYCFLSRSATMIQLKSRMNCGSAFYHAGEGEARTLLDAAINEEQTG